MARNRKYSSGGFSLDSAETRSEELSLGVYKLHADVQNIEHATTGSACFDISAYLPSGKVVNFYNNLNEKKTIASREFVALSVVGIALDPGMRALIPTGLILDIPEGYSVRLHPRSGLSLKSGVTLTNSEGVIDSDYVEEVFVSVRNISDKRIVIANGERIAQAELVKNVEYSISVLNKAPTQKTTRSGGFGSTGS